MTRSAIAAAVVVLSGFSVAAGAQEFPSKTVRIVVPFPAGGSFDIMSRMLAQRMQRPGSTPKW
ncbi:MAG: hypothetical protein JWM26_279 [Betaproteobacteria bacterium]|nr:hypothetical protein [Betaproteobacteria bacterium]